MYNNTGINSFKTFIIFNDKFTAYVVYIYLDMNHQLMLASDDKIKLEKALDTTLFTYHYMASNIISKTFILMDLM